MRENEKESITDTGQFSSGLVELLLPEVHSNGNDQLAVACSGLGLRREVLVEVQIFGVDFPAEDENLRKVQGKGEREKYSQLNADFQRIARRDKKPLSEQCKEIEENNRMGKTRDLFKKIGVTKGTFHAKMGTIKDRNGMDLLEAEGIKKRWQEYTEELYKKGLHDSDNHDGVITHLEPDILECEVK